MIHYEEGCRAAQFEHIILPDAVGGFTTRLFAVEGKPGIYKRVPKNHEIKLGEDVVEARFGGSVILLTRAVTIEAELAEAGFHLPQVAQERVEEDQTAQLGPLEVEPHHKKRLRTG